MSISLGTRVKTPPSPNGFVLWEGASLLDGAPIVMIGTGYAKKSQNVKTGAMIQTWILRSDIAPVEAIKTGEDASICGDCPLRGDEDGKNRGCYVNVYWAPGRVFDTYLRGGYPTLTEGAVKDAHEGRVVRLGAYGDPAAVPVVYLRAIVSLAESWTGYTHQWRTTRLQDLCMASVDSGEESLEAHELGYRTFRTVRSVEDRQKGEIICPASAEAGFKTTCEKCRLCDGAHGTGPQPLGTLKDKRKNISIVVHGAGKRAAAGVVG